MSGEVDASRRNPTIEADAFTRCPLSAVLRAI